ncbi:YdeI/OmpD-associated family protein [Paracoccus wurundjeri]|uniref:YdeI/OmpD-associated family protein n=1 Tax=Paracoccus onubensis TaxID=1675788 RepID=UPI00351D0A4D
MIAIRLGTASPHDCLRADCCHSASSRFIFTCDLLVDIPRSGGQNRKLPFFAVPMNSAQMNLPGGLMTNDFLHGTVHEASEDLQAAVRSNPKVLTQWENLTPLGRNEFICWVDDAKQAKTRQRRIERTCDELLEGKKRPCCWAGCIHRTDKKPGRWQQAVLIDKQGKSRP